MAASGVIKEAAKASMSRAKEGDEMGRSIRGERRGARRVRWMRMGGGMYEAVKGRRTRRRGRSLVISGVASGTELSWQA